MSDQDLIHQADALMNRHRAHSAPTSGSAPSAQEDDVPVLTEVVDLPDELAPPLPETQTPVPDPMIATRAALARELEAWLDERLPDVVVRILDGLSDQLITQVAAQARLELLPRLKAALQDPKSKAE